MDAKCRFLPEFTRFSVCINTIEKQVEKALIDYRLLNVGEGGGGG